MTEEEAKAKWCPFARVAGQMGGEAQGTSFNRWTSGAAGGAADPAACIASACMAWRTVREEISGTDQDGFGYVRSAVTGGYCGLAGKP